MAKIKTIGVLTSGGDAPGMNAAIRAVTRAAIYNGWKIKAIYRGWEGLINNEIKDFTSESVSGIINRRGDGMCPFEQAVLEAADPASAWTLIRQKLQKF